MKEKIINLDGDIMQIGWIDFSKDERSRVLSVMDMLSEPGAVDELGIGTIRDNFSRIFFPGVTSIQTRAFFEVVRFLLNDRDKLKEFRTVWDDYCQPS